MIKIGLCTPTAGFIHAAYTMSVLKMVLYFLSHPVLGREAENHTHSVLTQMQVGSCISQARDNMVNIALRENCTHVLFIDDDMSFKEDCLNIMLSRQLPIVLGNYRRKIPPGQFTAQNADNTAEIFTTMDSTSLTPCFYGGFGFCLIERQVLEAVPEPRFLMQYIPEANLYTTEDLPFFQAVHKAGFDVWCDQEVSKRLGHNGNYEYTFDDDQLMQSKARNRT